MRKILCEIILSAIFAGTLILTSCTPGSCFEETNSYLKASFYLTGDGTNTAPDSLTLYGTGRDTSIIYNKKGSVKVALMPLDAAAASCSFVVRINGVSDTITFLYSSYPHLISKECGYTYYHEIEPPVFTGKIIDTVTVSRSTITTRSEENIRIYY